MPAQKSKSLWTDGEPDEEQQALSEKYGWEYTARIRDFHVYRCFDPAAREPNTDAAVQALALNAVKKRQQRERMDKALTAGFMWNTSSFGALRWHGR
ncbi:MAG: hypothetical protein MJ074_00770 [Oscillospiraceae bacterium]|nr:hypothetical protein [Oscillospiraceae bacterium]